MPPIPTAAAAAHWFRDAPNLRAPYEMAREVASARAAYERIPESDAMARRIACEVCHVLTDAAEFRGLKLPAPPPIAHTIDAEGFVLVAGARVRNNAAEGLAGLLRDTDHLAPCDRSGCPGLYPSRMTLLCRWEWAAGLGVLYYHAPADGFGLCASCNPATRVHARDASGAELARRVLAGDRVAALEWCERVGSWPSDDPVRRAVTARAERLAR